MIHMNVEGVNIMLGYDLKPMRDMQVRLGKVNVQLLTSNIADSIGRWDDEFKTVYPEIVVDIADLRKRLVAPGTRAEWEKELRYQIGINDQLHELYGDMTGVTDVFAKRILATQLFRNAGWRTNQATLDVERILR